MAYCQWKRWINRAIPAEIGNLTNLETLGFYNCSLTGTIPVEILNLTKLQTLELSFNNFDAAPNARFRTIDPTQ
jgi:Leucine-rich repeat (LRR) protein